MALSEERRALLDAAVAATRELGAVLIDVGDEGHGAYLVAGKASAAGVEYATWRLDRPSGRLYWGHYFASLDVAATDYRGRLAGGVGLPALARRREEAA